MRTNGCLCSRGNFKIRNKKCGFWSSSNTRKKNLFLEPKSRLCGVVFITKKPHEVCRLDRNCFILQRSSSVFCLVSNRFALGSAWVTCCQITFCQTCTTFAQRPFISDIILQVESWNLKTQLSLHGSSSRGNVREKQQNMFDSRNATACVFSLSIICPSQGAEACSHVVLKWILWYFSLCGFRPSWVW